MVLSTNNERHTQFQKVARVSNKKRTIKIKDRVDGITERFETWVLSRLTSLGVMRKDSSTTTLVPKFKHGNDGKDLPLGSNRDGVPLGLGGEVDRWVGRTGECLGPREHKVGLNTISNKCEHGNAAVLDFGMTEPSNGGLVTLGPEVGVGKVLKRAREVKPNGKLA